MRMFLIAAALISGCASANANVIIPNQQAAMRTGQAATGGLMIYDIVKTKRQREENEKFVDSIAPRWVD